MSLNPVGRVSRLTASQTRRPVKLAAAVALALSVAAPLYAQNRGDGFLFHAPDARLSIRGGYAHASAGSDLFAFTTDELTLNKSDFSGLTGGVELAMPIAPRWEIGLDASYARSSKGSEFRHFIDNNNLPIQQTTDFERVPLLVNVRYDLAPLGRSIGRLAWIPSKVVPWVGAGAGTMWYRFHQIGDFVDFANNNTVFHDEFTSDAWTPALQGMGGVDISLTPIVALTADARYLWGKAPLSQDFGGFDKIDLSGVSATVGLTFRLF